MRQRRLVFALSVALALAVPASAEPPFSFEATPCCLPKDVRPLAYRLDIRPDLDKFASANGQDDIGFTGEEEVDIDVVKSTDAITLNVVNITFGNVAIDGVAANVDKVDEKKQTATIRAASNLAVGRHKLAITYYGKVIPQPHGLYYADYETPSGKARMLITQLEATDARRMFPCWDEPIFKATLSLSAEVPANFHAISNMPIVAEALTSPGRKKVTFAGTPKMSSYLAVLVAGQIEGIHQTVAGVDVGVDAAEGREQEGRYALGVVADVLPYYNEYFGVSYPLPKLDLIAVPNFAASAMENWGGITYIDNVLLFNPADSSLATKDRIFEVVAHEMAHQWSGDLVTMAWWNNLWLNEGFATWMQKKATDRFNPAWKVWSRAHEDKEQAMAEDALRTAHPIEQEIVEESKIDSAFDNINYEKGAAVVRMLEAYLGEAKFRDGMRIYMKAHAYSNATTADLWAALETASGMPVAAIATSFTEFPGIPMLDVTTHCVGGKIIATLKQDRFSIHNPYVEARVWQLPVMIGQLGDPAPRKIIVGETEQKVEFSNCGQPVIANFGDVGYYRVRYDEMGLAALRTAYKQLAAEDRLVVLADSWAMVQAGRADAKSFLDLLKQLAGETDLAVWTRVIDTLRQIDDLERDSPGRAAFRAFACGLITPQLERLGWDPKNNEQDTAPLDQLLRPLVLTTLGRFGDQGVIDEARRRFALFRQNAETLQPELREAVATVVGYSADRTTFDALRDLGRKATATEAKLRYYYALAGAHDPALIQEAVGIALTDEVPSGRVDRYLVHAATANDHPDQFWRLVVNRRDAVLSKLTRAQQQKLLPSIARASSAPKLAFELKWGIGSGASEGARYEIDKAVEEIEFKAEFSERLLPQVDAWVKANGRQDRI